MGQPCLAEKLWLASSAMTGYLALGAPPSSNNAAACLTNASSVSSSLMRCLAAANSPRSLVDSPGLTPRSMRSRALHRYSVASASPDSAPPPAPAGPRELHHPLAELRIVGSWQASSSALGRASLT
jgi:hypothetical protein